MAIAYDATANGHDYTGTVSSVTYSHTCSGSNRLLLVGVTGDVTNDKITGVTYNGVAMTLAGKILTPGDRYIYLFYLLNPASGANNVVVSASSNTWMTSISVSYTGVAQSDQPDASTTNSASASTDYSTTVTTTDDNCWTIEYINTGANRALTEQGITYKRVDRVSIDGCAVLDSNSAITPAGSTSLRVTCLSQNLASIMASFTPAPPGATVDVSETFLMSETRISGIGFAKFDTFSLSDSMSAVFTAFINFVETINVSDLLAQIGAAIVNFSETIGLTEAKNLSLSLVKQTEIVISDSVSALKGLFVNFIETFSVTDSMNTVLSAIVDFVDTFVISGTKNLAIGIFKQSSIIISDSISMARIGIINVIDTIVTSDIFKTLNVWDFIVKHTASWTHPDKNSSTWTEPSKNNSNWTFKDKT